MSKVKPLVWSHLGSRKIEAHTPFGVYVVDELKGKWWEPDNMDSPSHSHEPKVEAEAHWVNSIRSSIID
jgi:hypothetical protein